MFRRARFLVCVSLVVSLFLSLPGSASGQAEENPNREVLGPQLQSLFRAEGTTKAYRPGEYPGEVAPLHVQMGAEGPSETTSGTELTTMQYGVIVYTQRPEVLRQNEIGFNSTHPKFVTARLTREEIATASRLAGVKSMRASGAAEPHNDVAAGVSGVRPLNNGRLNDTEYTGSGAIVCVIDSGIDFTHRDFRGISDDTQSRILYIWDQTLSTQGGEETPAQRGDSDLSGFNYGVEYTQTHIEDEIDGSAPNFVRQEDTDGHGTHVAGTAAGNGGGHPEQKYKGMAPETDIIVVKAGNQIFPFSNVIDGMNYCGEVAEDEGKPVVVNMSLGADSGPHDGTSSQDQAVDNFVSSESGRAVVVSAGNEGNSGMHTSSTLAANGGTTTFDINVPSSVSSGEFRADTWISSGDDATIEVQTPNGTTVGPLTPADADGELIQSTNDGRVRLLNFTPISLGGGDRRLWVEVDDDDGNPPAQGTWSVTVTNTSSNNVDHHVWLFDASVTSSVSASLVGGDSNYTIGTPGSSKNAITIGSWVHRWRWTTNSGSTLSYGSPNRSDDISAFSSIGPLRDETQKPELAAPGQGMGSSLSGDMSVSSLRILPGGNHRLTQGTSMSSPATAGAVALLLQEDPALTYSDIKTTLQNTARTDGFTGTAPNDTWGYGKLDALRAMIRTVGPSSMPAANSQREVLTYDDWGSGSSNILSGSQRFAVRFTPSFNGVVTNVLLHPGFPSNVNLSGPLNVEIWSDDGSGLPDQKLGSTVSWDQGLVFAYTWNALDVTDADVKVQAGTDYHVVLSLVNGGSDDMSVRYDDGSVDNRSSTFDGSSWSAFGSGDFRMRPVVTTLNRQATIVGTDGTGNDTGWRLLSLPADAERGDLEGDLDFNVDSGSLLHTWDGGSSNAWNAATSSSHPLPAGKGFILYFFDDTADPLTSTGTTVDVPNGTEDLSTNKTVSGLTQSHQFHLLGDPFDEAFDLSELKTPGGSTFTTDFQAAVMVWDPSGSGQWTTVTEDPGSSNDRIASGQGFFVERSNPGSGPTNLEFNTAGKLGIGETGDVIGSKAEGSGSDTRRALVDLNLTVTSEADTLAGDKAKALFTEVGAEGWDTYEASQLPPPNSSSYVTLTSPIERDGELVRRLQASRAYPMATDTITVPLSARSVQLGGTARLRWPDEERSAVPGEWTVSLEDTETGARANLREEAYTFDLEEGAGTLSTPEEARFRLHVVPSSAIPVELAGFDAQTTGEETVRLTWQTASETDNAGFAVQRQGGNERGGLGERGNGEEWEQVGWVDGSGTTSQPQTYRFEDADLPYTSDSLTYRLRQVDTDGTERMSKAVTVRRGVPERLSLRAPFPNPVSGQATLRFGVPEAAEGQIEVYDVLGRRVATVTEGRFEAGRHEHRLDVGAWASGTYFLRLRAGQQVRTRKLTVVR